MELQMRYLVPDLGVNKEMERSLCSSSGKVERKITEKNRRNHLKNLYFTLNSLIPPQTSKEPLSLPEQINEAVNYIKSLQTRLKESKEKKESLMGRKRSHRCTNSNMAAANQAMGSLKSPEIRIEEMGSAIEVVLTTGQDNQFMFYEMIRILHGEGADILNANFSVVGNTVFHIVHAELGAHMFNFGATKIKEKLNRFVRGASCEQELREELWDYEIHPDEILDFGIM